MSSPGFNGGVPSPHESIDSASRSELCTDTSQSVSSTATTTTACASTPGTNTPKSSGTASTTSGSINELRDAAQRTRDVAERLGREGSRRYGLTAKESNDRISQLKRDIHAAGKDRLPSKDGLFKAACSTDLLFLVDTTYSMMGHIKAAKDQIKSIVTDIKQTFLNEAQVRVAVVGYKDHKSTVNIEFLDFTLSSEVVWNFIDGLQATGGADLPEDVLGGLQQAIHATWRQQTRCIIHIADAPPHGNTLHDSDIHDDYPIPGSEPHELTHEPLLKQMIGLNINYALLRINHNTDRMAFVFLEAYIKASGEGKLLSTNKYYREACAMSTVTRNGYGHSSYSKSGSKGGLLFEEASLGTSFSALSHLVGQIVVNSASATAVRYTSSRTRSSRTTTTTGKDMSSNLNAIDEDDDAPKEIELEKCYPRWDAEGWLNETLVVEGFSPDVTVHGSSTLDDMMADDDNIIMGVTELTVRKRNRPFAQGAMRVAAYARTASSINRFVVKSFKKDGKQLPHLAEDMRCQALCKAFALEFNNFFELDEPATATASISTLPGITILRDTKPTIDPTEGAAHDKLPAARLAPVVTPVITDLPATTPTSRDQTKSASTPAIVTLPGITILSRNAPVAAVSPLAVPKRSIAPKEPHSIDFIVTTCLKGRAGWKSRDNCLSLEPFIDGTYVKYNNNVGYVHKDNTDQFNLAAQAFSHFTFERSQGRFLVCDLQGVGKVLTDPVIHTKDPERFKLSDTNLGREGFKFFFSTHKCNNICKKLGLKTSAAMIISGVYEFREDWPSMDNTVCCSNKLCGKIVRLASAKKSDEFHSYHWCDTCWPQLEAFKTEKVCVEIGEHHEFEVSEFFYESQGRKTPRRCPAHREEDLLIPRPVVLEKPTPIEPLGSPWQHVDMPMHSRSSSVGFGTGALGSMNMVVNSGSATAHASSATVSRSALAGYDVAGRDRNLWERMRVATRKKSSFFRRG